MGLFDKKNKDSTQKKSGFSRGGNNFDQADDSVQQSFDNLGNEMQDGFEQAGKKVKKSRKAKKQKAKKPNNGGFLSFLLGKKKNQKQNVGLNDSFDVAMQNNHSNLDNQSGQFSNNPMSNDTMNNMKVGQMGMEQNSPQLTDNGTGFSTESGFGNSGLNVDVNLTNEATSKKGTAKKSLFGKKKPKSSGLSKPHKKTGGKKGAVDGKLLKILGIFFVVVILGALVALLLMGTGTSGTISSNAKPSISETSVQPEQNPDTTENVNSEQPKANVQNNVQPANGGQPTVVEADAGKIAQPVNTKKAPANSEPKPENSTKNKPAEQIISPENPEIAKIDVKKEQPKPKKKVNKPIAINTGSQIDSAIKNSRKQPASQLSYEDFLKESGNKIYREE